MTLPPLSLYIHIPWCVRKCPYCDFNSHERHEDLPEKAYLAALLQDLKLDLPFTQGRTIKTIFIGGGTPSLMSGEFYQQLLAKLEDLLTFDKEIEITLEANPGTTEATRFEAYFQAGINRLSLGVQSFNDAHLKGLGRIHSAAQAERAVREAQAAGFSNFNIDLMHGLPDQSAAQALEDLELAVALGPTHLSWYQLTIEPNTAFYSSPPVLPVEDELWAIQQQGAEYLAGQGYLQYEVSAFSRSGLQAKHNKNYWRFGDYIGIGAGAHSKVSFGDSGRILRYRKSRLPKDYLTPRPSFRVGEEDISINDLPFEFLMNVLRLRDGVEATLYEGTTGLLLSDIEPKFEVLRREGLMHPTRIQLTEHGFGFLNSILERFV